MEKTKEKPNYKTKLLDTIPEKKFIQNNCIIDEILEKMEQQLQSLIELKEIS